MVPSLPEGFIQRPSELEHLIGLLVTERGEVALLGAGGTGKTVLAAAACHDSRVVEEFYDGILWTTLGSSPNLVNAIAELYVALASERPAFLSVGDAAAALREVLSSRRAIIVIDDVWSEAALEPFLRGGPECVRLITTRDDWVLPRDTMKVAVDAMRPSEAVLLLIRDLPAFPAALQSRIDELAQRRLGGWPLLLSQANALLCDRVERGEPAERAFEYLERSLARRGLAGTLRGDDPEDRRRSASGTLDISLDQLDAERVRTRFGELGVFAEDAEISLASIGTLWSRDDEWDEFEVDDLCARLANFLFFGSLISGGAPYGCTTSCARCCASGSASNIWLSWRRRWSMAGAGVAVAIGPGSPTPMDCASCRPTSRRSKGPMN
jgi:hypothetical protein